MVLLLALCATLLCSPALAPPGVVWRYPLDGPPHVVRGFAPPSPLAPWRPGNRGVDLATVPGAVVRAAGTGLVSFAGPLAGRGVVAIRHGLLRTTYEPVEPSVQVGERVVAGQPIGRVQPTRSRCPPRTCLHWGLLRGDVYLDPMLLLGGRPVRLLPWLSSSVAAPGGGGGVPGLSRQHLAPITAPAHPAHGSPGHSETVAGWVAGGAAGGTGVGSLLLVRRARRPHGPGP